MLLGDNYMKTIEKNPFLPPVTENAHDYMQDQHRLELLFLKNTPIYKRNNHSARAKMLDLQASFRPMTRPSTSYVSSRGRGLNYSQLKEDLYAPIKAGKFAGLEESDRNFLEGLQRESGPPEPMSKFMNKQKEIFLLELNLQDKQKEKDRLNGDLRMREQNIKQMEAQLNVEVARFDQEVKLADRAAIEYAQGEEREARDRMRVK